MGAGDQCQRHRTWLYRHRQHPLRNDKDRYKAILERIHRRWGTPEDFAGPAVFLASSASDYVNGEILTVDGGWMGR